MRLSTVGGEANPSLSYCAQGLQAETVDCSLKHEWGCNLVLEMSAILGQFGGILHVVSIVV